MNYHTLINSVSLNMHADLIILTEAKKYTSQNEAEEVGQSHGHNFYTLLHVL